MQQLVKDQELDGLIVVIPQITKAGQSVADNLTGNEYIPATWQLLDHLTETEFEIGIYWGAMTDGNHKSTWIYAHALDAGYDWLISQSRQTEVERGKLEALQALEGYNTTLQEVE